MYDLKYDPEERNNIAFKPSTKVGKRNARVFHVVG